MTLVPVDPVERDFAVRLLTRFLRLCESPRTRARMVKLIQGSTGSARAGRMLYRMINRSVLNPVARATGVQSSAMRTELLASQLIGLAMLRYVIKVEPMASASVDEVIALAAPSIRATLRG
ncbi:hypothetical protein FB382_001942 [Nocardioides ginsengisegetis]|uniref:Tetracyclin repressor-like C-terminal domain-containing protein n=1 Tax=Nocardioides ginsengisegetis TaxID=661491 RepID=A0A7W3P9N5_9ACTN|nr:hypothetical protein [Nocardioides ginsengisegetis]